MPFSWLELWYLAEDIYNDKLTRNPSVSKECCLRTVCSRAYYSAFCLTKEYEERNSRYVRPTIKKSKGSHKDLIEHLEGKLGKQHVTVKNIRELRKNRVESDYNNPFRKMPPGTLLAEALKSLHLAKDVITNHCGIQL